MSAHPYEKIPLVLEVIACSVVDAIQAWRGGADRLEVISHFEMGGLTPPLELVRDIGRAVPLPLRVMLRENDGYEVEDDAEVERLCSAARDLAALKVDGVVLGFLRAGKVDSDVTRRILACAPNLKATFHHALEASSDPIAAIQVVKTFPQVDRILMSGKGDLAEQIQRLNAYVKEASPELVVLAGGGLDAAKIRSIRVGTTIREFHVGRAVRLPASVDGTVSSELVRMLYRLQAEDRL